jgi:uncharacterized cupin superfamily protein
MGYHVVDPTTVAPRDGLPGTHRYLDDAVELSRLSVQLVEADPGDEFAPYHAHDEGDEVFYVLDGSMHVETPDGDFLVEAGNWFAVEPGNPIRPYNPATATAPVRALLVNPRADDFRP